MRDCLATAPSGGHDPRPRPALGLAPRRPNALSPDSRHRRCERGGGHRGESGYKLYKRNRRTRHHVMCCHAMCYMLHGSCTIVRAHAHTILCYITITIIKYLASDKRERAVTRSVEHACSITPSSLRAFLHYVGLDPNTSRTTPVVTTPRLTHKRITVQQTCIGCKDVSKQP